MWYDDADYGSVEVRRAADGSLIIDRADPVIGIALSMLSEQSESFYVQPDLTVVIAGTLRYRIERVTTDDVVICRRIGH
jgi:hypothetical protein